MLKRVILFLKYEIYIINRNNHVYICTTGSLYKKLNKNLIIWTSVKEIDMQIWLLIRDSETIIHFKITAKTSC